MVIIVHKLIKLYATDRVSIRPYVGISPSHHVPRRCDTTYVNMDFMRQVAMQIGMANSTYQVFRILDIHFSILGLVIYTV